MLDYHHSRPSSPTVRQRSATNESGWVSPMNRSPEASPQMLHSFGPQYEPTRPHTSGGQSNGKSNQQYADATNYPSPNSLMRDLRLLKPRPRPGPRPAPREAPGPAPRVAPSLIPRPASPQAYVGSRPGTPVIRPGSPLARPGSPLARPASPQTLPDQRPTTPQIGPTSPQLRTSSRLGTSQKRPESPERKSGSPPAATQAKATSPHLVSKSTKTSTQARTGPATQTRSISPHLTTKSAPTTSLLGLRFKSSSSQSKKNSLPVDESAVPASDQVQYLPRTSSVQAQHSQPTLHIASQMQASQTNAPQVQPRSRSDLSVTDSTARLTVWPSATNAIPVSPTLAAKLHTHTTTGGPRPVQARRTQTQGASQPSDTGEAHIGARQWQSLGNVSSKKLTTASIDKELPALPQENPGAAQKNDDGAYDDEDEEDSTLDDMPVSKLDVEIPTAEFDRFSVMFPSFMSLADRRATILARRQIKGQGKGPALSQGLSIAPPPMPQLPSTIQKILNSDVRRQRTPPAQLSPIKIPSISTEAPLASSPLLPDVPSSGILPEITKCKINLAQPINSAASLKTPMPPLIQAKSSESVRTVVPDLPIEEYAYNDESDPNANYDLISSYASPSPPPSPASNDASSSYAFSTPSFDLDLDPAASLPPTPSSEILHLLPSTPSPTNSLSPHPLFYNKEPRPASPLSQSRGIQSHKVKTHKHTPSKLDLAEESPLSPHLVLAQTVRLSRASKSMIKRPSHSTLSESKSGASPKLAPTASPKLVPTASPKLPLNTSPKPTPTASPKPAPSAFNRMIPASPPKQTPAPTRIQIEEKPKPQKPEISSLKTNLAPLTDKTRPKSKALPPTPPSSAKDSERQRPRPAGPPKALPPTPPPESVATEHEEPSPVSQPESTPVAEPATAEPAPQFEPSADTTTTTRKPSIAERITRADEAIMRLARAQKALQDATRAEAT